MFFIQSVEMNIDSSEEFFLQNLLDKYYSKIIFQGNSWKRDSDERQLSIIEPISIFSLF